MGLLECSETGYRRAIDLNPTTARIYWMHARQFLYQGRPEKAVEEMRPVIAAYPNQFKALSYQGEFLYYAGKIRRSREATSARSLDVRPRHQEIFRRSCQPFLYASRGTARQNRPCRF